MARFILGVTGASGAVYATRTAMHLKRRGHEIASHGLTHHYFERVPAEELRTDILKYPHHGRNALTAEFLEAVNPAAAVITNVNVDWFGVKYLKHNKIPYYFSCFKRTVLHLWTDGNIWVIEQPPISKVTPMK